MRHWATPKAAFYGGADLRSPQSTSSPTVHGGLSHVERLPLERKNYRKICLVQRAFSLSRLRFVSWSNIRRDALVSVFDVPHHHQPRSNFTIAMDVADPPHGNSPEFQDEDNALDASNIRNSRTLPDDLPTSLDDRRSVPVFPSETEMYDGWQGGHLPASLLVRRDSKSPVAS